MALKSRASPVPKSARIEKPSTAAPRAVALNDHPTASEAMTRITAWGNACTADTIVAATGNISRGIAIFRTMALFRTIDRVPELNVSVKKWTKTRPQNRWIAKLRSEEHTSELQSRQ